MSNRRQNKLPVWVGWIGDMSTMNKYLESKPWMSPWFLIKTLNTILRAIGVVAFANSPMTGTLIFLGMVIGNVNVALACVGCGTIGTLLNLGLKVNPNDLRDGVCVFNGILVGCIICAVAPPILGLNLSFGFCILLVIAVIACCYIDHGINAAISAFRLPGQSLPFNVTAAIFFMAIKGYQDNHIVGVSDINDFEFHGNITQEIDWTQIIKGSITAAGQVYGVGTLYSSYLVWMGFFVYSPLLTIHFFIGSLIGTIGGTFVSPAPYIDVYAGLWGYNSLLTCGGISFFLVPSHHSFFASLIGSVIAFVTQAACEPVFAENLVPVFSYPFNVAIFILLAISTKSNSNLIFIHERTFNELHIYKYYVTGELKRKDRNSLEDGSAESPLNENQLRK